MEKDFKQRLEDLCFDVLGDHTDLDNIEIMELKQNKYAVVIKRKNLVYSPLEFLRDDWYRAIENTEFENVDLYM